MVKRIPAVAAERRRHFPRHAHGALVPVIGQVAADLGALSAGPQALNLEKLTGRAAATGEAVLGHDMTE
jgi:hypothetical protein